jgi:hypothetical protein
LIEAGLRWELTTRFNKDCTPVKLASADGFIIARWTGTALLLMPVILDPTVVSNDSREECLATAVEGRYPRVTLATVLAHELGHVLGLPDSSEGVMLYRAAKGVVCDDRFPLDSELAVISTKRIEIGGGW